MDEKLPEPVKAGAELVPPLTDEEAERFAELEAMIVEVCGDLVHAAERFETLGLAAIEEVRDGRLYRQRFSTFDDWCEAMLGKSRLAVTRAIQRSRKIRALPPVVPQRITKDDGAVSTPLTDEPPPVVDDSPALPAALPEGTTSPTPPVRTSSPQSIVPPGGGRVGGTSEPEQMRLFIPAALKGEDVKRLVVVVGNQSADVLAHSTSAEALRRTIAQCRAALRLLDTEPAPAPAPDLPPPRLTPPIVRRPSPSPNVKPKRHAPGCTCLGCAEPKKASRG